MLLTLLLTHFTEPFQTPLYFVLISSPSSTLPLTRFRFVAVLYLRWLELSTRCSVRLLETDRLE